MLNAVTRKGINNDILEYAELEYKQVIVYEGDMYAVTGTMDNGVIMAQRIKSDFTLSMVVDYFETEEVVDEYYRGEPSRTIKFYNKL